MHAHLTQNDTGTIPPSIPVTTFLTNPSHRIKVMPAPIFALAKQVSKNSRQYKKMDTWRIKNTEDTTFTKTET